MIELFHQFKPQVDLGFDPRKVREGEPVDRVKQSFKEECDINTIVRRFEQTGEFPYVNPREASFGDVTGLEFRSMLDTVLEAQAAFDALPADVRDRFNHDPVKFVDFCSKKENAAELEKLGLAAKPLAEDPESKVVTVKDLKEAFKVKAPEAPTS